MQESPISLTTHAVDFLTSSPIGCILSFLLSCLHVEVENSILNRLGRSNNSIFAAGSQSVTEVNVERYVLWDLFINHALEFQTYKCY